MKVGVVGLGAMGEHHVRVYSGLDCEIMGITDTDKGKKRLAKKYKTSFYSDYTELIGHVDVVSVAVPTLLHKEVALDFIKAGVHCLVEKPIAASLEEAEELIREAKKNNVKLMVGHIERFNPAVLKLKEIVDDNILGKLMIISTRRVGPFVSRIRDVGIIVDLATHDIDVACFLTGKEPADVYAKLGGFKHKKGDYAIIVLDFGTVTASIEVNWFTPQKVRNLVVTGSEGVAYLDYIKQDVTIHNAGCEMNQKINKEEPLKIELKHFMDCIENDKEPLVNGYNGLKVLEIALNANECR